MRIRIIDNGESQDLEAFEVLALAASGLVFKCEECSYGDQHVLHVPYDVRMDFGTNDKDVLLDSLSGSR